ncbi:MAG: hypothetical protein JW904_08750 [Spirochaetales bacterium]|nr:hypothetical protein [Spirochaetales bacterium]
MKFRVFISVFITGILFFYGCDAPGSPEPETIRYDFLYTVGADASALALSQEAYNFKPVELDPLKRYVISGPIGVYGSAVNYYLCVTFQQTGDYIFSCPDLSSIIDIDCYIRQTDTTLIQEIVPATDNTISIAAGTSYLLNMHKTTTSGYAATTGIFIEAAE